MRTIPMKWADELRYHENPCVLCGKPIKGHAVYMIHVISGGGAILHPDDEHLYEPDSGDMDWHSVGSSCAKKLKGYAVKQKDHAQ